ncbi:uncharacterized protein LOC100158953 [Acyrthosiphon pisum]|uniref:Tudor domain-containing protein n=1 Tax=Acyrthosiphon pisum TaxID=7029 RepID=A0A8R2NPX1_ACYPI|nr:uncharacterized protein LOC100158953 [Acyrthosiphon pisum]
MIEQGFALSKKQVKMDGEYSTIRSQSEPEFNYSSVSKENDEFVNSWMPPNRLVKSQFNAIVTNVDLECHINFQILDDETPQSLQLVKDELNYIFSNSQPEPINMEWSRGQSVIVKYYQDNKWYRGTILKINENGEFTVQFYDYGNIETCTHKELRSTLHTTEVPQLCHRGFFSAILPITKNGKWPIPWLDHIHNLIVDKTCRMTIDENLSTDDVYAIKSLKIVEDNIDVFQYLVTEKMAYFEYVSSSIIDLVDTDEINNGDAADDTKCDGANDNISNATYDNGHDDCTTYVDGGSIYDSGGLTYGERRQSYDDGGRQTYDDGVAPANVVAEERRATSVGAPDASVVILDEDDGEESDYSKFCLERNEVVEGTMCRITGPTSLTLVITKIGGVDLIVAKNNMHKVMSDKCSTLPPPNHIKPGTAVIVYHNVLWRRGLVEDGGNSVFLVDFGMSIKLVKKNVRRCIAEFFELPMFTIDCRLENVRPSDDADAKDVVDKLSKTLRGVSLKIIGISESDDGDIVGVELYNRKEEIAYQSLIDAKLLIPAE